MHLKREAAILLKKLCVKKPFGVEHSLTEHFLLFSPKQSQETEGPRMRKTLAHGCSLAVYLPPACSIDWRRKVNRAGSFREIASCRMGVLEQKSHTDWKAPASENVGYI